VIGDISCDIEGAIECTVRATSIDNPIYVYDPIDDRTIDGYKGRGVVIMAIDNLACELPRESSVHFSKMLMRFIPEIAKCDFSREFEHCNLPKEIKNAVIAYKGKLTPNYRYIEKFL
jgi:alpha-aminoadipic semialdehyde synthase